MAMRVHYLTPNMIEKIPSSIGTFYLDKTIPQRQPSGFWGMGYYIDCIRIVEETGKDFMTLSMKKLTHRRGLPNFVSSLSMLRITNHGVRARTWFKSMVMRRFANMHTPLS